MAWSLGVVIALTIALPSWMGHSSSALSQESIQDGRVGSYALISSLDPLVFSGLVVVSKDPAGHLLIFIHQRWMDSVMEAKTSLSCHNYFPSFTLLIIQRMSMSV
jgi:hypothetical protein